jgi:hypothetical protein
MSARFAAAFSTRFNSVALTLVCPFRLAVASWLEAATFSVWPPAPDAVLAAEPAPWRAWVPASGPVWVRAPESQVLRFAVSAPVSMGEAANFSVWLLVLVGPAAASQPVVSPVAEEQVVSVVAEQPWSAAEELVLLVAAAERASSVAFV